VEALRALLTRGLEELGAPFSDRTVSLFMAFLAELKKWCNAYSLTALRSDEEIVTKHFLDSLLYLCHIPSGCRDLCDIGSGAGFPGLPLAIVRPELRVTLIEPSRKKCAFLRHVVRRLPLENVAVVEGRVEEVDQVFDVAVTRALFSIGDLLKRAERILRDGGYLVASKGPRGLEEIMTLRGSAQMEVKEVTLPGTRVKRFLVKVMPRSGRSDVGTVENRQ
jgi:16S rRNA (guanine527-N7)-methyltransferase